MKRSAITKRLRPPSRGSIRRLCSPSKMPGTNRRPSQRSSRFLSTARTVGLNVSRPRSRRLDSHLKPRPLAKLAADPADERIPLGVGVEIGHDRPHTLRRRVDLDLRKQRSQVAEYYSGRHNRRGPIHTTLLHVNKRDVTMRAAYAGADRRLTAYRPLQLRRDLLVGSPYRRREMPGTTVGVGPRIGHLGQRPVGLGRASDAAHDDLEVVGIAWALPSVPCWAGLTDRSFGWETQPAWDFLMRIPLVQTVARSRCPRTIARWQRTEEAMAHGTLIGSWSRLSR